MINQMLSKILGLALSLSMALITFAFGIFAAKVVYLLQAPLPEINNEQTQISHLVEHLLWDENESLTKIYWTPAMELLVRIGPAAVPRLIEAIETAPNKAASIEYSGGMKPSELGIRWDAELIQTRAAMVLGEIGDERAIEVLNKLRCKEGTIMCRHVQEAIGKIRKKSRKE